MDELLAADERAAAQRDAEYRRLVAEQAALRRLAVLVTAGSNRPRCSTRWSKKCADAWTWNGRDFGATRQAAKSLC